MWTCSKCSRIFKSKNQPHSCKKTPLEQHFEGKEKAQEIFQHLVNKINKHIGKTKTISIPCCIHLFGKYDFLAALPKKDRLEIRIALDKKLNSSKIKACVPLSSKYYKNVFDILSKEEINKEVLGWIKSSYHLKG